MSDAGFFKPPAASAAVPDQPAVDDWRVPGADAEPAEPAQEAPGPQIERTVELPPEEPKAAPPKDEIACPHCRRLIPEARRFFDASEEDRKAWIRYFRGEPRFRRTYTLYDGSFSVTYRTRTSTEMDAVFTQLELEVARKDIPQLERYANPKYAYRMLRLSAVLSVDRITLSDDSGNPPRVIVFPEVTEANFPAKGDDTLLERAEKAFLARVPNTAWLSTLQGCLTVFDELCTSLESRMNDPNFFKTAGGPS